MMPFGYNQTLQHIKEQKIITIIHNQIQSFQHYLSFFIILLSFKYYMLLINFDFSDINFPTKIAAINLPIIALEAITYPLLRVQHILLNKPNYVTNNQIREMQFIIRSMIGTQKFPKYLHGIRYSFDHSITYTTARFLIFQKIISYVENMDKMHIYGSVLLSTFLSTIVSQPSFNYRSLAAQIQVNSNNSSETLKNSFLVLNKTKILTSGLAYASVINSCIAMSELFFFTNVKKYFKKDKTLVDLFPALITNILVTTVTHPLHFLRIQKLNSEFFNKKQDQITFKNTFKGLWGSIFRRTIYNTSLFVVYNMYFNYLESSTIENTYEKRQIHSTVQKYRQGKPLQQQKDKKSRHKIQKV